MIIKYYISFHKKLSLFMFINNSLSKYSIIHPVKSFIVFALMANSQQEENILDESKNVYNGDNLLSNCKHGS